MSETQAPQAEIQADAPPPEPTMEESLEANYDRAVAAEDGEGESPEPASPDAPAEPDPSILRRGADGRFMPADAPEGGAEGQNPAADGAAPQQQAQPTVPDYVAPYAAEFAARGMTPEQGVAGVLNTWRQLEANPEATLSWLASRYGMHINFAHRQAQQPQQARQDDPTADEWVDPQYAALKQELDALKAERQQEQQAIQAQRAQALQHAYGQMSQEVENFARTNAHEGISFDALRPMMAAFVQSGQADTLEQAYEMASWAHPQTRPIRESMARKQAEAQASKQASEKAAAARRAAAVNVRSDTAAPGRPTSIDDSLSRIYDEIQSR